MSDMIAVFLATKSFEPVANAIRYVGSHNMVLSHHRRLDCFWVVNDRECNALGTSLMPLNLTLDSVQLHVHLKLLSSGSSSSVSRKRLYTALTA